LLSRKEILQLERISKGDKMPEGPEQRFNIGAVKATIWKNTSRAGEEFRTARLSRSYKKGNEWKDTNSLGVRDIDKAIKVLEQARDYIKGLSGG
jgi:hypothetical protein